ncbi:hypothetical protein QF042_000665 [Pedobacter sp. W3I1]|nr:hypothetical protein [Pedobacter sp. W3I1]
MNMINRNLLTLRMIIDMEFNITTGITLTMMIRLNRPDN